jgi:hypothetical protein
MSYLLADVLGLSGILSCFVCAILVSHYALHNVSQEGRETTMNAFKTLSYLAEGMIFIYVGMDALDPLKWKVRVQSPLVGMEGLKHKILVGQTLRRDWKAYVMIFASMYCLFTGRCKSGTCGSLGIGLKEGYTFAWRSALFICFTQNHLPPQHSPGKLSMWEETAT